MAEPTMRSLFVCIARVLARGSRYRLPVGVTRHRTCILLDHPEEPLPVAEIISIRNSGQVWMWRPMNSPSQRMDLLCSGHRTRGEDGIPPLGTLNFGPHSNRGQTPNPSAHSDESDSDSHQHESSAGATKRITRLSMKKTGAACEGLDKGGAAVRRTAMNRSLTQITLWPPRSCEPWILVSHYLLVRNPLPLLLTWRYVPSGLADL